VKKQDCKYNLIKSQKAFIVIYS